MNDTKKSRKEFGTAKANVTNKAKKTSLVANKTSNETEEKNREQHRNLKSPEMFCFVVVRVEELMLSLDENSETLNKNLKEKEKEIRNLERR